MELGLRFSFALRGANGENFSAMIDCDEDQAHYRRSASSPFHYIGSRGQPHPLRNPVHHSSR